MYAMEECGCGSSSCQFASSSLFTLPIHLSQSTIPARGWDTASNLDQNFSNYFSLYPYSNREEGFVRESSTRGLYSSTNFGAWSSMENETTHPFHYLPSLVNDSPVEPVTNIEFLSDRMRLMGIHDNGVSPGAGWNGVINNPQSLRMGREMDFTDLKDMVLGDDHRMVQQLIVTLQGSYADMMTDKQGRTLFQNLLNTCKGDQFNSLVNIIFSEKQKFIDAAFCNEGKSSIIQLIKKIRRTRHEFTLTRMISTRFWDMATHSIARNVIHHCLLLFGNEAKQILFQQAIHYFLDLAMDKLGCLCLNECVDHSTDEQKRRLLNLVADASNYLATDPYGNYVVQNALNHREPFTTAKILNHLQGQYVQLAQQQEGSHVVEKCIQVFFPIGMIKVAHDIILTPGATLMLAQHQFGNYVIQKLLQSSKEHGYHSVYNSLVSYLELHRDQLSGSQGGVCVLKLLDSAAHRNEVRYYY